MQKQIQEIHIDKINIYGGTQARLKTNEDAIESYAEEMQRGAVFPPINVYFDGATYWLADGFHERSGIEVRLDLPNSMPRLSRDEELTLFRIAQEALTNVHRHAESPWASVRLRERGESIVLEIEDRGLGNRAAGASGGSFAMGVGLAGMRERVKQVGGSLTVEAGGSGTIVRAMLPRIPP